MSPEALTLEHDQCDCGKALSDCECECTCTQDDQCVRCHRLGKALDQITINHYVAYGFDLNG
jgi:hypothetical protein